MKTKNSFAAGVALVLLMSSFATVPSAQSAAGDEVVRLCGSTTVVANVFENDKAEISKAAGVELSIVSNGSRQGLVDLANGRCDIAMISAPLGEILSTLPAKEKAALPVDRVTISALGEAKLLFIVHATNPVKRLTIAQLSDLLTGAVTNWKQVGGASLKVDVVSNQFSSGQRAIVEDKVAKGKPLVADAKLVVNDSMIPGVVRQISGALGHAAAKTDLTGTHTVDVNPPITQPMALVTRENASPLVAKVLAAAQSVARGR